MCTPILTLHSMHLTCRVYQLKRLLVHVLKVQASVSTNCSHFGIMQKCQRQLVDEDERPKEDQASIIIFRFQTYTTYNFCGLPFIPTPNSKRFYRDCRQEDSNQAWWEILARRLVNNMPTMKKRAKPEVSNTAIMISLD